MSEARIPLLSSEDAAKALAELLGLRDSCASDRFDERDRAVLPATDEVLETGTLAAGTWERCESVLASDADRLELVTAIATWHFVSLLTRSLEIPPEEGVASWPPDGVRPPSAAPDS